MDIIIWIIRGIILHNPVDVRKVKTSLGNVSADENALFSLAEFKVSSGSLLLLLLAVDVFDRDVDVVEEVAVELYCITTGHENHHLLFQVLLQKCE